ncbi:MAG: hypothetical protein V1706_03020 [Pseudomonadota bacterium]
MKKLFVFWVILSLYGMIFPFMPRAGGGAVDKTMEIFGNVPGISVEQLDAGKGVVENMDYTSMRVFRALCSLPDMTPVEALRLLPSIKEDALGYDHLLLFEQFCALEGVTVHMALSALPEIRDLGYTTVWSATSLFLVPKIKREQALSGLAALRDMRDAGRWSAKAFFETMGQTGTSIAQGLARISVMSDPQNRAAEAGHKIGGITALQALSLMDDIKVIGPDDIANVRALLGLPEMTPAAAHAWLTGYFVLSEDDRDTAYMHLASDEKKILLRAFFNASDYFVRMINDFHSVCNQDGDEISEGELRSYSFDGLSALFYRLPGGARVKFSQAFSAALQKRDKGSVIYVLRDATAFSRKYAATQLSTANIYALMTRVSVLYDSSFRLILIPELQKRIASLSGGRLLTFLQGVDPENIFVANFVSSLSLKGRLGVFFPSDLAGQEEILELVAASAFQDENSLVLFAATFEKLLIAILPGARDFMIDKMLAKASDENIFAKQVRTILQYFLAEQPKILGQENKERIVSLLGKHAPINLGKYWETPFAEWRQDGVLSSLSVFHGDDDGHSSFVANCSFLVDKGYGLRSSVRFRSEGVSPVGNEMLRGILFNVGQKKSGGIDKLFTFLKQNEMVVDFFKQVGPVEVSHSISVYRGADSQQILLEQFINDRHEMFAHRGHSYWLNEHILDPLQKLLETGRIKKENLIGKTRFLSIGACGGVNIYADLTRTFCGTIDVLGSLGAGKTRINNLYNWFLFETVAGGKEEMSWKEVDSRAQPLFAEDPEKDYQLPGELPSILYKVVGEERCWF